MKNYNVRIAVIEEGNFYNRLIENQIFDVCYEKHYKGINLIIKSFRDAEVFRKDSKTVYEAIIIDNYFKNGNRPIGYNVKEIVDEVKLKNKNCLLISITGYREMQILAEFYADGELQCYYSKQCSISKENQEENCSIPSIYKLMEKFITSRQQKYVSGMHAKRVSSRLKISA